MEFLKSRDLAIAVRDKIDATTTREINRQQLEDFISGIWAIQKNRRKIYKPDGSYVGAIKDVLRESRLSIFTEILEKVSNN